jgi:hypothetical protein
MIIMSSDTGSVIEYSINDGATWHHGKTIEAWAALNALAALDACVREYARAEHGNVEHIVTRVLAEDDPRAVNNLAVTGGYPPGTPVIAGSRESYPAVILTPPAAIAGHRVLAWAESRRRDGEYPGGTVLCVSNPANRGRREYVTWNAYTKDGGETWAAETGHYITDHEAAWADFTDRAQARPATEF